MDMYFTPLGIFNVQRRTTLRLIKRQQVGVLIGKRFIAIGGSFPQRSFAFLRGSIQRCQDSLKSHTS